MSNEKNVEQFFSQLRGSMDLIVEACALLVAKHPDKASLLGTLSILAQPIDNQDSEQGKHYKMGVLRALGSIAKRVENLEAQIELGDIPPTDRH